MAFRRHDKGVTDAAVYDATNSQELTSILNAPDGQNAASWFSWPFSASTMSAEGPPLLPAGTLPEVDLGDFAAYLKKIASKYEAFEQERTANTGLVCRKVTLNSEEVKASQGQGLVAASREVPGLFFQESFDIDRQDIWSLLGDVGSEEERQHALDKLGHFLDVVETHLVREIASRSDNFFDAASSIQELQGKLKNLYQQISSMRNKMSEIEQESSHLVERSQQLQLQRANVLETLEVLKAMEEVAQAQAALQGLLPEAAGGGGMAADFVGAIDVLEVLQGVLDNERLLELDCFRSLPQQIAETAQAVDDLMVSDFLERARYCGERAATSRILRRLCCQLSATQTPRGGAPSPQGGAPPRSRLSSEESVEGAEAQLLATVKLADQASLQRVASWVGGSADAEGNSAVCEASLQESLLPLVMGMRRMGRLSAALKDFRDLSCVGMSDLIRDVVEESLSTLGLRPSDAVHLVAGPSTSPPRGGGSTKSSASERLQQLPGEHFQWVLQAVLLAVQTYLDHCTRVCAAVHSVLHAAGVQRQQLEGADEECRAVCHAVAETALGRWAKLLSGRAHAGTAAAARLEELREVLDITDVLGTLVEGHGVKSVLPLRNALQQVCKATLDSMHSRAVAKLTSLLEQEQWSLVEVPLQFHKVLERLLARGEPPPAAAPARSSAFPQRGASQQAAPAVRGEDGETNGKAVDARLEGVVGAGEVRLEAGGPSTGTPTAAALSAAAGGDPAPRDPSLNRQDGTAEASTSGRPHSAPARQGQAPARKYTITPQEDRGGAGAVRPKEVLVIQGRRYHVVNTALMLLSMLGDYLSFRDAVPAFAAEIAQRVLELLKIFNSRTCQLVLGAGAMQVSGLKSITAKHLAISCQCLGVIIALRPALTTAFTQSVPGPRQAMLSADFSRTAQDYVIHRDEICSKLVFIMRERLSMNLKQLPAITATWPAGPTPAARRGQQGQAQEGGGIPPPSSFATTNIKQLHILSGVLAPLLLPEELHSIFGRVVQMFSSTLVEAFGGLEGRGPAWEAQLQADVLALVECLEGLPGEAGRQDPSLETLRLLCKQRFELALQVEQGQHAQDATHQPQQQQGSGREGVQDAGEEQHSGAGRPAQPAPGGSESWEGRCRGGAPEQEGAQQAGMIPQEGMPAEGNCLEGGVMEAGSAAMVSGTLTEGECEHGLDAAALTQVDTPAAEVEGGPLCESTPPSVPQSEAEGGTAVAGDAPPACGGKQQLETQPQATPAQHRIQHHGTADPGSDPAPATIPFGGYDDVEHGLSTMSTSAAIQHPLDPHSGHHLQGSPCDVPWEANPSRLGDQVDADDILTSVEQRVEDSMPSTMASNTVCDARLS